MNRSKKKLFVTDLDNTALGGGYMPYARFPDHFSAFLDELSANGWDWAINTTWDPDGQWDLVRLSALKSRPAFLIGEFSRRIAAVSGNRMVPLESYIAEQDRKVNEFCREKILPVIAEACLKFHPERMNYYGHLTNLVLPESTDMDAVRKHFAESFADPELVCGIGKNSFSLRPAYLGKGLGMDYLIREYGYDPENIVTAGDHTPDIAMMERSKISLCPSNACPEVKEFVSAHHGAIGEREYAYGIIDAFRKIFA